MLSALLSDIDIAGQRCIGGALNESMPSLCEIAVPFKVELAGSLPATGVLVAIFNNVLLPACFSSSKLDEVIPGWLHLTTLHLVVPHGFSNVSNNFG